MLRSMGAAHPFGDHPCDRCSTRLPGGMAAISGCDGQTVVLCPNCAVVHAPAVVATVSAHDGDCAACGGAAPEVVTVDLGRMVVTLCRAHAIGLLLTRLNPGAYHRLVSDIGGDPEAEFLLHGDFYDADTGEALQPRGAGRDTLWVDGDGV